MSLEDVKKKLEALDGGQELMDKIVNLIETEKQQGIEAKTKANNEAKNLRDRLKGLEPMKDAMISLGWKEDQKLDDFTNVIKTKLDKPSDNGNADLEKLKMEFNSLKEKYTTSEAERKQLRDSRRMDTIKNTLSKALKNEKGDDLFYGSDLLINNLISDGRVNILEDDKTVVFKNGDENIGLDDGVKKLLDERKDLLRNKQSPGGSSDGGDPQTPNSGISIDDIYKKVNVKTDTFGIY